MTDLEKRKSLEIHEEFASLGLEPIDVSLSARPPKIKWGRAYLEKWTDRQRVEYLEKLLGSMNEAAAKIQEERDELGRMCNIKEAKLGQQEKAVRDNNAMLQSEISRMNEDRQSMLREVAKLKARVRELENE